MKRNIRNIPTAVLKKLDTLKGKNVVAACAKWYSSDEIRNGELAHLQVQLQNGILQFPERIIPPAIRGKYSARNVHGYEVVRRDLPIETHYHLADTPNWGSYYGTHTVWLPHKAYPKDFHSPREREIILHCPNTEGDREGFLLIARVDEVLAQTSSDFGEQFLENLNLLQENFGTCGVEAADSTFSDYTRTLHVSWDILPPGSRDETIQRLFMGRNPTEAQKETAEARYTFFRSLHPRQIIIGSSGFRRYFGALLETNLVIFENIEYGNAIYVMYENWETLARRSRIDLLSGRLGDEFDRVIHTEGWETKIRRIIEERRGRN